MPSDEDQIQALLRNEAHALVLRTLGITVSSDAVVNYLLLNHSISDVAFTRESQQDGYYALPGDGCWVVYDQERTTDSDRHIMYSEKDVFSHFTKTVLHTAPDREN